MKTDSVPALSAFSAEAPTADFVPDFTLLEEEVREFNLSFGLPDLDLLGFHLLRLLFKSL